MWKVLEVFFGNQTVLMDLGGSRWVSPCLRGYCWVLVGFSGSWRVSVCPAWSQRVLVVFGGFQWVSVGPARSQRLSEHLSRSWQALAGPGRSVGFSVMYKVLKVFLGIKNVLVCLGMSWQDLTGFGWYRLVLVSLGRFLRLSAGLGRSQ